MLNNSKLEKSAILSFNVDYFMKRRLIVLSPFCFGLLGCAAPRGTGYQRIVRESRSFIPSFTFVFNSEHFSASVAKELEYLRAADFEVRFREVFSAVLVHNGLSADVTVVPAVPQLVDRATLLAEVYDVRLFNNRLSRLVWRWSLFNPEGILVSKWESEEPWEGYGTWSRAPNMSHVESCIKNLALLALNTLNENGHITLSRTPAETPFGAHRALS